MGLFLLVKSISSFALFTELLLLIFFVDCSLLSFGICDSLKLNTGSIYYPNFQVYRFLTFFLVNTNFVLFVFDAAAYVVFDLVVQKRWNFAEKVKFLVITTWLPGFMCLIYYYIKYANSKTDADLFFTGVSGSSSFAAAVTVAVKQLLYDTSSHTRLQKLYRYGPILYLLVIFLLQFFRVVCHIIIMYSFFGFLYGWTYLRFFQKHTDGRRGDFRGSFAFVCFFPLMLQPILAIPLNCLYAVFVALRLIPKIDQQCEILSASSLSRDVPTFSYNDNERHKRIALQDLSARLAKKQEPLEEWPALFDEEVHSPPSTSSAAPPPPAQPPISSKDTLPDV